jgi:DNA segregation ATPase FtsK/SpoIIIE, S-DNA-T family
VVPAQLAGLVAALVIWWRAHPASFDRWAAPTLRSARRRWTVYRGRRWARLLDDCDLTRENRRTGQTLCPRVLRVRSVTPSIDTVAVRMVRGQDLQAWTEHTPALADALRAERVAVSRKRPGVLTVIVERRNPFPHPLDATPIPESSTEVDLSRLDVGDNEYGGPFSVNLRGKRLLVVGASGAGKSSLLWNPLRAAGPMIRDRLLRVWMIDLKGGTETERGQALFCRWATTLDAAIDLLTDFRDSMRDRQAWMRANQVRRCQITTATPYELLMIDELAMLTAYGDRSAVREALRLLAEVLTQGRAADHGVAGYVQEPTKDVVDVRELFDTRICLGVTAASHVDMALGDGARDRGALADEIPGDPEHAGIGFVIDTGSRLPVRFRAGWVTDTDIDDLATRCAPRTNTGQEDGS